MKRVMYTILGLGFIYCFGFSAPALLQSESQVPGSPDASVYTLERQRPFPPGHIQAKSTDDGIELKWGTNRLDPTLSYKIYRTIGSSTTKVGIAKGGTFTDHDAPIGKLLEYRVAAVNQFDVESVPSKPVVVVGGNKE